MAKGTGNKQDAIREHEAARQQLLAATVKFIKAEMAAGGDLTTLDARVRQAVLEAMSEGAAAALGKEDAAPPGRDGGATDERHAEQTATKRTEVRRSSRPPARFTERQGKYLAFIDTYTKLHGRPPAQTDIQRHFKVSPPSVHQMILTLERRGLLRRTPGQARSLEVLVPSEELPSLG